MTEEKKAYNKVYYADPVNRKRTQEYGVKYYAEHRDALKRASNNRYRQGQKDGTVMVCWVMDRYEGVPCLDCDHVFPWECMDFDYRPEETKSFGIGTRRSYVITPERIAEVMKEISKCDLVCANCHRVRTKERKRS